MSYPSESCNISREWGGHAYPYQQRLLPANPGFLPPAPIGLNLAPSPEEDPETPLMVPKIESTV